MNLSKNCVDKNNVKDDDYIKKIIGLLFAYFIYFLKNLRSIILKLGDYFYIVLLDFGSDLEIAIKGGIINFFSEINELINNISKI